MNMTTATDSRAQALPADDELDDILNGLAEGRDISGTSFSQPAPPPPVQAPSSTGDGLGIDEEIIVTKKRIPIPKLDDYRLLSDPGIPRLQRISKERLRFKGKGHEYGDIARMLNMYQLWLDDLYPRAKFADALTIIEKVGHTKRMQLMRKDWIYEGKAQRTSKHGDSEEDQVVESSRTERAADAVEGGAQNRGIDSDRDGMDVEGQNDPDEDELDALLAEGIPPPRPITTQIEDRPVDDFADEMDAIADMEHMW